MPAAALGGLAVDWAAGCMVYMRFMALALVECAGGAMHLIAFAAGLARRFGRWIRGWLVCR